MGNESKSKCEPDEAEQKLCRCDKTKQTEQNNEGDSTKSQLRREPPKILCWNAHGLINKDTKWKIDALKEHVQVNNIFLMNFTETWFEKEIQDEEIPGYTTFRSDRKSEKKKKGGGAAIYLKNGFEARLLMNDQVESCEIVAIEIEKTNIINIVIYRPPDTDLSTFTRVMNKVKRLLSVMDTPEPTVLITGDFNFPFIEWKRNEMGACAWRKKTTVHGTIDQQKQFDRLLEVAEKYHLIQTVEEPTRIGNTLDLVFTNNIDIITQHDVSKTIMSDHNIIEITTNIKDYNGQIPNTENEAEGEEDDLRLLNFHHEEVCWEEIKELIRELPWAKLFEGKNNEECTEIFIYFIKMICIWKIPRKTVKNRNRIPKERKNMLNRIKMLKRKKHNAKNRHKEKCIEKNILETELKLKEHREWERNTMEEKVIDNMKENPKVFFDYIRRQKDKDTKIGPFKRGKDYIYDAKEICKMLIEQYNSQFSERNETMKATEEEINSIEEGDLVVIIFNEEDISNAIGNLKKNSTAGPDGTPAIFLINISRLHLR